MNLKMMYVFIQNNLHKALYKPDFHVIVHFLFAVYNNGGNQFRPPESTDDKRILRFRDPRLPEKNPWFRS